MMKFKLVLFDLGGTLINYDNQSWEELGRLGCIEGASLIKETLNIDIDPAALNIKLHTAVDQMMTSPDYSNFELDLIKLTRETLESFGIRLSDGLPRKFIDAYYKPIRKQVSLLPYAREILMKIKNAGIKIGLVSNTIFPAEYHKTEMRQYGLYDYFDFVLFSSEEKIRKPGKEIYHRALNLGNAKAEDTVFIGDRLVEDVGGPQSVGIRGVLKYTKARDYSADIEPYETIHSLEELENIIFE